MQIIIEKIQRLYKKVSKGLGPLKNVEQVIVHSLVKERHIFIVEDLDANLPLKIKQTWVSTQPNLTSKIT